LKGKPIAGKLPLKIEIRHLSQSGAFDLPVQLQAPGLQPQRFMLLLSATDNALFPFLAILLGVGISFGARWITQRDEPRQLLLELVNILREDIQKLRLKTSKPTTGNDLQSWMDQLNKIELRSELANLGDLKTVVDQIESQMLALREDRAKRRIEFEASIIKNDELLRREIRRVAPDSPDSHKLAALYESLRVINRRLPEDRLDEVEDALRLWRSDWDDWLQPKLQSLLQTLRAVEVPEADIQARHALQREIAHLLNDNKLDEARAKLFELSELLTPYLSVVPEGLDEPAGAVAAEEPPPLTLPAPQEPDFLAAADAARNRVRCGRLALGRK
jgi:hypothetical protein